ncbi:hypothetical protein JOB18_017770 [Solea senegalensis]|uniref:Uncharacterized protein n=1 Tax=Solea senegalensis TaxID=28829 RepID=A0AAV6Q841_SOLSE|nr:hypothetical protein JOB18_017770 [Solea senegalensis]
MITCVVIIRQHALQQLTGSPVSQVSRERAYSSDTDTICDFYHKALSSHETCHIMRCYLFLLIYLLCCWFGQSDARRNDTCTAKETCSTKWDPTSNFLHCVGLSGGDTGRDHMKRLKGVLEATMDVYTFMKSSMTGVPFLTLQGDLEMHREADPLQNEALVQMWLDVKIVPLLKSITKQFLSCLSTKNFSCTTYQTVVRELSHYYSEMEPNRQNWIYTFFMYPFLSGDRVSGCVSPHENNEEWLIKNFGAFRAMARLKDLSKLNLIFSGLEVLHLLSPAQKAELLLSPEVESWDNSTLTLVFNSLLTGGSGPHSTPRPDGGDNTTTPGFLSIYPKPPQQTMTQVLNGFMMALRPVGSFIHEFVSFTHERNVSEIKSTTLTQFVLNWTLSELADMYRPQNGSVVPERPKIDFDVNNVEDWYKKVVIPLLQSFLPSNDSLMHQNIKLAFHRVFYLEHGMMDNETTELVDVCSITLNKGACGLTNVVENVANIMHCAARTNLTITDITIMRLIGELTKQLNSLIMELSKANFRELASDFQQIFSEVDPPSLTQEHLRDPDFIKLWFKVKMMPLLPDIPPALLSCLSTKNFSCPVYQTIVAGLSKHMSVMDADPMYSHNIYKHFIHSFMMHQNTSEPQCLSAVNNSAEWLSKNFGFFSRFAVVTDLYELNANFSGLEVLHLLSPKQLAEMMVLPLPTPPEKHVVINSVFDFLEANPEQLPEVLHYLGQLAKEVDPPCGVYIHIFKQLYAVIPYLHLDMEPVIWAGIDVLMDIAPQECLPKNLTCPATAFNASFICKGIDSSELESHLNTWHSMAVPCNFTLETYACAQLENFTAHQLVSLLKCNLPGNSSHSKMIWKMVLTKLSFILDPALDIIANTSMTMVVPSASVVLDVIGEMRVSLLTDEQLMNSSEISTWFSGRLSAFLPFASERFLQCLIQKNLSCQSYHQIIAGLSEHMRMMDADPMYSHNIYKHFILSYLMHQNTLEPQCLSAVNNSAEWLSKNFGFFSRFAVVTDLYELNRNFSGLEVLHLLSPKQLAEMMVLPLPTPPEKHVVINSVFDFLEANPEQLPEVLHYLVSLAKEVDPPCGVYIHIFKQLYALIPPVHNDMEPHVWAGIDDLMNIAPEECVLKNLTCPATTFNASFICKGIDSSELESHLNTWHSMAVPCNFTLETYACAQLENFTAHQLVSLLKCNLPGNSSPSKMLWKMVLTKLSFVLDPALDIIANTSMTMEGPSASEVLDILGEMRVSLLTDEQLMNSSEISTWFSGRLSAFLPSASGQFLQCLIQKNLSCQSYQQILQGFFHHSEYMSVKQKNVVLMSFIIPFLSQPHSDLGCVNGSNSSAEWLMKNLGPFSMSLSVEELLYLNPHFNPLEDLGLLTPKQSVELLVLSHPNLPDQNTIVDMVFNHLTEPPEQKKLPEFLFYLTMLLPQANLSCSAYKILFTRMDLAMVQVPLSLASNITHSKNILFQHMPPGCIIYKGNCNVTMTNETDICLGVNSTALQLHLDRWNVSGKMCDFAIEEFACASLLALTAQDVAEMLMCNRSSDSSGSIAAWKLLLSKTSHVLDGALDLLASETSDPKNPALPKILGAIRELRLDTFNVVSFNDPVFIQQWFNGRLLPFLPAVSADFLSCIATKALNCSTYQHIVQILSHAQPHMTLATQMFVYTHFIHVFLTKNFTADPVCSFNTNNSGDWLQKNFGGFSVLVSTHDLQMLHPKFSAMEALPELTVRQLAEVSSTPGQLTSSAQVDMLMNHVPSHELSAFFDAYSPAIMGNEHSFPSVVRSAMLQVVFDRANLSDPSVSDSTVILWLHNRLRPLLFDLSPGHVAPFFKILTGRNCSLEQQGVDELNSTMSSLSGEAKEGIHNNIIQQLTGPVPLRCYGDSHNQSFYGFLEQTFMGFQFPNLTTFLLLMPHDRMPQLVNSMPPSDLGAFLRRPDAVDDDAQLCVLYNNYKQTPAFLETESLPEAVGQSTLPCVWPMALESSESSEVNAWFDQSLPNYMGFLTKDLISPNVTYNSSCLAFQKLVSLLGVYNYTSVDFKRPDVFDSIRTYLTSATIPRCYNSDDPELNSTAWFAEYIGPFMPFLTLEDLQTFGSSEVIQVFTVNPLNIALLNHSTLSLNLTNYYTELVYLQDSNFNPLFLPLVCRCVAPGPSFSQLNGEETLIMLYNLTTVCTDLDPQISSALAGNLGDSIDATAITALGTESSGLSTGQIHTIKPDDLVDSLSILSTVNGWNEGQARAIIASIMSSGKFEITNSSSLLKLGSLIVGVPASMFGSINGVQLVNAAENPTFLTHLMSTPRIIQLIFVKQIISVNSNSEAMMVNVPDEMATEIPRTQVLTFTSTSVIRMVNKKKWKHQQAELFFDVLAVEDVTTELGGANNLSSSVLQGFTCTGVRTIKKVQIKKLVKACRRKGKKKVKLTETQLTCMYNHIKGESDATSFDQYPSDVLLYYDYSQVPQSSCRSYFGQISDADFSVFSNDLSYKRTNLLNNAKSCLGVTDTSLSEDNIRLLGNMCCYVDPSYIEDSDPYILEILKTCSDLTDTQASAAQTLLLSGKTPYGEPSTWDRQTLEDLDMLPLYMTSTFYEQFDRKTKRKFLRYFRRFLKRSGVGRRKRRKFKRAIRQSLRKKSKRSIADECTVGNITQVTISDETFPFDYDEVAQFNCCLSATTVKDNLAAIAEKVDEQEYLQIVLSKLHEAYASTASIPEDQVQVLGPVSREADIAQINKWTITQIDTLSALMDSSDGEWDPSMAKVIISKYLSVAGNELGSVELNAIGGTNLCALDVDALKNISQQSLKEADALDVSNCTTEKKRELFAIATEAFSETSRSSVAVSVSTYQLAKSYLGVQI